MFSSAEISSTPIDKLALSKEHEHVFAMATDRVNIAWKLRQPLLILGHGLTTYSIT